MLLICVMRRMQGVIIKKIVYLPLFDIRLKHRREYRILDSALSF